MSVVVNGTGKSDTDLITNFFSETGRKRIQKEKYSGGGNTRKFLSFLKTPNLLNDSLKKIDVESLNETAILTRRAEEKIKRIRKV